MTKKIVIPVELKYDFAIRAYASLHKGYLYEIREKYGAAAALEIYEKLIKRDDRMKNLANLLLKIFKIEGNDAETIAKWWDIYWELTGIEGTWLERSKKIARCKITKCPFKYKYEDLSDCSLILNSIITRTINPKATTKRPKGKCAGDPYCEYVHKLEE
jgi:hypothetical protein